MPSKLLPMLATSASDLPAERGDEWTYELKWDGVRALAYLTKGSLHLESRNQNDITGRYPELHALAGEGGRHDLVLDGEVVAFDADGRPSFSLLQTRMHVVGDRNVAARVGAHPIAFLIFDVLHLDGTSTRDLPLVERRRLLDALALSGPAWQTPSAHVGTGEAVLAASRSRGLEGVVAKRSSSLYVPGKRSRDWLKIKNTHRQELVLGGWLPGAGNRSGRIGAVLAGYFADTADGPVLRFAGKVGTGFSDAELAKLSALFTRLASETSPFADRVAYRDARFVRPELVAEVEFTEWTHNGTLRHPSYKGLRDDKAAAEVRRER